LGIFKGSTSPVFVEWGACAMAQWPVQVYRHICRWLLVV